MVNINDEEELKFDSLNKNINEARKRREATQKNLNQNAFNTSVFKNSAPPPRTQSYHPASATRNPAVSQQRTSAVQKPSSSQRSDFAQNKSTSQKTVNTQRTVNSQRTANTQRAQNTSYKSAPKATPSTTIQKKKKKERDIPTFLFKIASLVCAFLTFIIGTYALIVFGNVPFIIKWRNIWIETAMTTDQHKWLATSFFPKGLIEDVMNAQVDVTDIGQTDILPNGDPDILGQKNLVVGEKDSHGNEVLVNNLDEGIVILKVTTSNFVGRLVMIDDPSRVYIEATDYKGSRGEFICDYLEEENAIVGMNASGFYDPGGTSIGGVVTAQTIAQGEYWGTYSSKYITVGFDTDNRLIVGEFSNWDDYNLRDAFQYHPALIINGDKVIEGSSGWGLQPRSVIGQCENGVVLWLVVDGRQVGYSLGATMGDCANVLEEYGAVNAGACDGGSSSVLAYDGEIINKPSTNMPTGRYLPNAWLVKSKKSVEVNNNENQY